MAYTLVEKIKYHLSRTIHPRACPCDPCKWHGEAFLPIGEGALTRTNAMCPWCMSRERHRLAYLLLHKEFESRRFRTLHVAPEKPLQPWLQSISSDYLSTDLLETSAKGMMNMDITELTLPDASRDLIWCSHVLEHVTSDRKAIGHFYRVLAPGGVAVLQVPVVGLTTQEDPNITSPEERRRLYLQDDHARLYGLDIVDRLTEAGFHVEVRRDTDLSPEMRFRHAVSFFMSNEVYVCYKKADRKPAAAGVRE